MSNMLELLLGGISSSQRQSPHFFPLGFRVLCRGFHLSAISLFAAGNSRAFRHPFHTLNRHQALGEQREPLSTTSLTAHPDFNRQMSALMVEIIHSIRDEELRELAAHRGKEGC